MRGGDQARGVSAGEQLRERLLGGEVDRRREAAEVAVHDARPGGAAELGRGSPSSSTVSPSARQPAGTRRADVVVHAQHADHRRRVDRDVAGLVVEADVAAGDRQAQLAAAVGQAADGLGELPHHLGLLGGAEVQAVGDASGLAPETATLR